MMDLVEPVCLLLGADPISQVVNQRWTSASDGTWIWSAHMGNLVASALITVGMLWIAARSIATGPESQGTDRYVTKSKFAHLIEVIIVGLRDQVIRPMLGKRTNSFLPFLLTLFFFIFVNNLLGMVPISKAIWLIRPDWKHDHVLPIGMTATQNIYITAALAIIAFIAINLAGVRELGIGGYLKHLTAETPVALWPLMIPIEIAGTLIKPIALAIRLFANMTAGHLLMIVLYGFAASGIELIVDGSIGLKPIGGIVTIAAVVGAIGVSFLELFVAFLQAFVFVFLTTVFISQLEHHGHDHEHEHGHGHDSAHPHSSHPQAHGSAHA